MSKWECLKQELQSRAEGRRVLLDGGGAMGACERYIIAAERNIMLDILRHMNIQDRKNCGSEMP